MKHSGRVIIVVVAIIVATLDICTTAYIVPDSIAERFAHRRLTDIEGVWVWSSGATIAVEADDHGDVTLTLLDSPDPAVVTPQPMGVGRFSGTGKGYDVNIRTKVDNHSGQLGKSTEKCLVSVDADGVMSIRPYSDRYQINLWRVVPYLFRFSVSKNKAPDEVNGAVRIFPQSPNHLIPPTL